MTAYLRTLYDKSTSAPFAVQFQGLDACRTWASPFNFSMLIVFPISPHLCSSAYAAEQSSCAFLNQYLVANNILTTS